MKIVLTFIDEVGIGSPPDQPFFGVGVFITEDSLTLNRSIHDVFTGAISYFRKDKTRFEFKFNEVTSNNLRFYKEIITLLERDNSWSFYAILIEKDPSKWESKDYWQIYLQLLDEIIDWITADKITLVADYLAKPKLTKKDLLNLKKKDKVANILQLESQGSLLLQTTDILLGSIHFEERRKLLKPERSKESKIKLSRTVNSLLRERQEDGRVKLQKMTAIEWLHAVKNKYTQKR